MKKSKNCLYSTIQFLMKKKIKQKTRNESEKCKEKKN